MTKQKALAALRNTLANLYSTKADAIRVVEDAELNPSTIEISDKAINNWHNILIEAEKHIDKVQAIINVVQSEYPENQTLKQAVQT